MDNETDEAWFWRMALEEVRDAHAALGEAERTGTDVETIAALGKAAIRTVMRAAKVAGTERVRMLQLRNYASSIAAVAVRTAYRREARVTGGES